MRQTRLSIPELILVAGTRAMIGAGIGMLVGTRLGHARVAVGATLLAIGALSTIPLALEVFHRGRVTEAPAT
ncbi:MAG TPA: hypothetical protein VHE35_05125 [Kofleriaceae bacterium]|nr:hypothetical protein [Kofleriaceae bacterium]